LDALQALDAQVDLTGKVEAALGIGLSEKKDRAPPAELRVTTP
jgi:hypothetical protein